MTQKGMEPISMTMTTSIDAMFKRKRGRPPKNRVIEVIIIRYIFYRAAFLANANT